LNNPRARQTAATAFAVLACALGCALLAGCSGNRPVPPAEAGGWYQIQAGAFQRVASPSASLAVRFLPWTVQARVADMAYLGDTLYCGINRWGLVSVAVSETGTPTFSYRFDALLFPHRTITALLPRRDRLTVHLYYNSVLNDASPGELANKSVSLVTFVPQRSEFSLLTPPFQRQNPGWEAVGMAAVSQDEYILEWKQADSLQTQFAYTRFRADTLQETASDQEAFRSALGIPSISGPLVPNPRASLFAAAQTQVSGQAPATALVFSVRSRQAPLTVSYRQVDSADAFVTIPVFEDGERRLALLPDGRVLTTRQDGALRTMTLPALPSGFHYTDLVENAGWLIVAWEEAQFTDVGRAGVLVVRSTL